VFPPLFPPLPEARRHRVTVSYNRGVLCVVVVCHVDTPDEAAAAAAQAFLRAAAARASRSERESERACSGGGVVWRRRPAIDRPPSSWTTSWIIITTQVFAALELCPLSAARVVIVGQDPYHAPGQVMTQIVSSTM